MKIVELSFFARLEGLYESSSFAAFLGEPNYSSLIFRENGGCREWGYVRTMSTQSLNCLSELDASEIATEYSFTPYS